MKYEYSFGLCLSCGQWSPLRNRKCLSCEEKDRVPDFIADLFKNKEEEKK